MVREQDINCWPAVVIGVDLVKLRTALCLTWIPRVVSVAAFQCFIAVCSLFGYKGMQEGKKKANDRGVATLTMSNEAEKGTDTRGRPMPDMFTFSKDSETEIPVDTEVTGTIPKWLKGSLYRNGSGVFRMGDQELEHFFDGFAVIHRFIIHEGEVKYQSRILDTDTWARSCKANRLAVSQFGTYAYPDPCKSIFSRLMSYLLPFPSEMSDNTCVNIVEHGDKLYALTDTPQLNEVDPETLHRKKQINLQETIAVHMSTAHPHFDRDGTMYTLGTSFNPTKAYNLVAIPPAQPGSEEKEPFQKASLVVSIPSQLKLHIGYNHSFGMTDNFFVVLEQPLKMSFLKVLTLNWRRKPVAEIFKTFPNKKLIFHIIRRSDNTVLPMTFQTGPTFCFHFINCYEEEDHLVVDFCGYSDASILTDLTVKNVPNKAELPNGTVQRFVLPCSLTMAEASVNLVKLKGSKATAYMTSPATIDLTPDYFTDEKIKMDLPQINYKVYNGKKYRFAYGASVDSKLVKVDLQQRKSLTWTEAGYTPGEPIFVAKPDAESEDDGVVLSPVLSDVPNVQSFLLVLDAKTFQEVGRATAPRGTKMANSFHGSFVATQDF